MRKYPIQRGLSVVLLFLAVLTVLTGCGYRQERASSSDLRVVGRVGNYDVTYDELYHVAMTCRDALKAVYGEEIFDTAESRELYREELEELTYRNITANYAIFELAAEIRYTEADVQEYVDEYMEGLVDSLGGMHAYRRFLHEAYMTDSVARSNYAASVLQSNVFYSYVNYLGLIESDAEAICDIVMEGDTFIRTRHIALFKDNGRTDAENRATMEEIERRLVGGADFEALLTEYGEDTEQTSDGYYFMKGEMQTAYETAAFALPSGERSGIVETEDGFYIIKRLEKQEEYVLLNCYGEGAPLYDSYQRYTFIAMVDERQAELTFAPNDYGRSVDLTALRQTVFFDVRYTFVLIGIALAVLGVCALIAWWCVLSVRADRNERASKKKRHGH